MRVVFVRVVFLGVLILALACGSHAPTEPTPEPDWVVSPAEDYEAEVAAVILSRTLLAPQNLYDRIKSDLEGIRAEFGDSIPAVQLTVRPVWELGEIAIRVDTLMLQDTTSAGYRRLDSLNRQFGLDSMKQYEMHFREYFSLYFSARYNPVRLVEIYLTVDGIFEVFPDGFAGDSPELYIYPDGDEFKYFFRNAWGDCPAGCIISDIYYVISKQGQFEFVGSWSNQDDPDPPRPAWMDTAMMARDTMSYWPESAEKR